MKFMEADIALIGLAVMGQNLVLNMNDHGFEVVVYNRTVAKVDEAPELRISHRTARVFRFQIRWYTKQPIASTGTRYMG